MKKFFVFISTFVISFYSMGQAEELTALVEKLQGTFSSVQSAAKTYEQEIKLMQFSTLTYTYNQTDLKGIRTTFSSEFNLADIDLYAVREETQKDIIFVVLSVKNKQKLIKTIKNGQTQSYDDELHIHAKDVDHARTVLDILKKCIPLGEKITAGKLKLNGYESMKQWLEGNVKDVGNGTKSITQSIKEQSYPASFKLIQIESDGKSAHQEEFTFNIADINLNTVVFKITGNSFMLNFSMLERLKSVSVLRDGVIKPFTDDITIFTNGVDEARDIKALFTMMSPLAQARVREDFPAFKNKEESLERLVSLTKDVRINTKTYSQGILPKCATTLSVTEQSAGATEVNTYEFNWMDVNPNTFRLSVSGEKIQLELPMLDKRKVVKHYKSDKVTGYEDEVSIYVDDIEVGRRLRNAVDKTIGFCKASFIEPFSPGIAEIIEWMRENTSEVTIEQVTRKQTLELVEEGNLNKLKFTVVEIKQSSSTEEVFEFNLSDINPNSVNYDISGKWLNVKFDTNFKNKIIKAYKGGKIQPYVFSLEMAMRDTETARGMIAALKKSTESFNGK